MPPPAKVEFVAPPAKEELVPPPAKEEFVPPPPKQESQPPARRPFAYEQQGSGVGSAEASASPPHSGDVQGEYALSEWAFPALPDKLKPLACRWLRVFLTA